MINEQHEHMGVDSNKVNWKNLKGLEGLVFAQGDVFYIDANETWQRLGAGTSGQYLKTQGTGANPTWGTVSKFGGDGSDGALSVTSGTTTVDCANAAIVIKNYTSISITGTGKLAFSNPHANGTIIILKSQGAVTITSSTAPCVDVSGMGATGGAGGISAGNPAGSSSAGSAGAALIQAFYTSVQGLVQARKSISFLVGSSGGGGGADRGGDGTAGSNSNYNFDTSNHYGGAGGAGTWANNYNGGAGGNGGGGLYIECGGAWNFTTASGISVAGKNGGNGTKNQDAASGAGGGGAAGSCIVLYNTLTASSGTITITGGSGGAGQTGLTSGGLGGGGGGGAGSWNGAGSAGQAGGVNYSGNGGAGANGFSLVASNTEFL